MVQGCVLPTYNNTNCRLHAPSQGSYFNSQLIRKGCASDDDSTARVPKGGNYSSVHQWDEQNVTHSYNRIEVLTHNIS